jgi:hypothetical protein
MFRLMKPSDVVEPGIHATLACRPLAWWENPWIQQFVGVAVAFLFASLAPALVMAALWLTTEIALTVLMFTFAIALGHAILLGLPLFLIFRSKGWINVMLCVVVGFAVGAAPAGVLTWPMQHALFHAFYGSVAAAGWLSYLKPLICFGSFGALGGFTFWFILRWFGGGAAAQPSMPANARPRVRAAHRCACGQPEAWSISDAA